VSQQNGGKLVFVLLITASEKHKNKGITSGSSRVCINAVFVSHALVFNGHIGVSSEFVNAPVHLFSSPVLRSSSVAATSYPQDPNKVFVRLRSSKSRALSALSHNFVCWGSAAACVCARLLKRLSYGSVTVFEPMC
jgi:hypothetical protein